MQKRATGSVDLLRGPIDEKGAPPKERRRKSNVNPQGQQPLSM